MIIAKPDLISANEWPGKLSYVIFIAGCNFRCGFCHNPDLVIEDNNIEKLSEHEVLDRLSKLKERNFVDAVCITGGEPLIHPEIEDFIRKIRRIGFPVRVETNGSMPRKMKKLVDYGLIQSIALDIKTSKEKYHLAAGKNVDLKNIEKSMLYTSLLDDYEFRTTIVPHIVEKQDILKIKNWLLHSTHQNTLKAYYLQRFKAGRLFGQFFSKLEPYPDKILEEMRDSVKSYFKKCEIR